MYEEYLSLVSMAREKGALGAYSSHGNPGKLTGLVRECCHLRNVSHIPIVYPVATVLSTLGPVFVCDPGTQRSRNLTLKVLGNTWFVSKQYIVQMGLG